MARQHPNPRLAALLHEAGWGPAKLARAINDLGAAQGLSLTYDRSSVAHWLTGSRPRPPIPELAASALSRGAGRLVTAEETGLLREGNGIPAGGLASEGLGAGGLPSGGPAVEGLPVDGPASEGLPAGGPASGGLTSGGLTSGGLALEGPLFGGVTPGGNVVVRLAELCRADAVPIRRARLASTAYSLAATAAPAWNPREHGLSVPPTRGGRRRATPEAVARLHRMTAVFADLMERHGGAHARSALTAYLAEDTVRLLTAQGTPELRRELFTGAAQLAHLLARMSMDAGSPSLAQRYFTAALDLAREADDRRLYAITLRAMSLQALHLGFREHAWHLAEAAIDTAGPGADPSTRAFLLSQRAVVHAYARHRREAVNDLRTAEIQHDRATSPGGPFDAYPRPGLDFQRGQALSALGDTAQAAQALTVAAEARADDRHRPLALTRARLAETLLPLGRLEESCVHWHAFLDHYPSLRSAPADQALTQLGASLRAFRRQPQAAAVLRRARGVVRSP
ncbi:hypothetical protein [Streptomyces sp. NPDC014894]|uniref:hypothetical protein n=1 Tax=Streptomyces sp. NPDC014894 TaxID=3364931 RepID=UPI0036F60D66